ncbi:MAG: toprim domain-containing protein, partial [Pseudomonadota bacterium]
MSDPTDPRARPAAPAPDAIERLIAQLAKLPGLGPRSAQRAVLHLARRPEERLAPLAQALAEVALHAAPCAQCGNIDIGEICRICRDPKRDMREICVVEDVGDLWAIERSGAFRGRYHVLGGVLSALGGVGPEDLRIPELLARAAGDGAERPPAELILALSATVDGQTTAHVL